MMQQKLIELITQFDPEIQEVVAEVLRKEREYLDHTKPRGIMLDIEDVIDRVARHGERRGSSR